MLPKASMMRVVCSMRGKEPAYLLDCSGKEPGRGAYICLNEQCVMKAHKNKGFERSYRRAVPKELYNELKQRLGVQELVGETNMQRN